MSFREKYDAIFGNIVRLLTSGRRLKRSIIVASLSVYSLSVRVTEMKYLMSRTVEKVWKDAIFTF